MRDVQDDINTIGWRDCLMWAIGEESVLAAFTDDTRLSFTPPENGLDAMIDDATGFKTVLYEQFVEWVTCNIWGIDCAPKAYLEHLAQRKAK